MFPDWEVTSYTAIFDQTNGITVEVRHV